jgi:hypothetical protein
MFIGKKMGVNHGNTHFLFAGVDVDVIWLVGRVGH